MSFDDPHTAFVIAAYAASALILAVLIWVSVSANSKARAALEDAEKERGR